MCGMYNHCVNCDNVDNVTIPDKCFKSFNLFNHGHIAVSITMWGLSLVNDQCFISTK